MKVLYVFLICVVSVFIALDDSGGGVGIYLWLMSIVFSCVLVLLCGIHALLKREPRLFVKVAWAVECAVLFVSSIMMGSDEQSFGYSDPYSVRFLGKTYGPESASHARIESLIYLVLWVWAFSFVAILVTIIISIPLANKVAQPIPKE